MSIESGKFTATGEDLKAPISPFLFENAFQQRQEELGIGISLPTIK